MTWAQAGGSGPGSYPGKLAAIEGAAFADILLFQGDPVKDISILLNPDNSLELIVKDGVIYKNQLEQGPG
jgi:imidazolonepropionase-like amidohydrolase